MIKYDTAQCKGPSDTQTFLHVQQSITDSKATGLLLLVLVPAQQSTSAAESSSAPLNGNKDIISMQKRKKKKHKPDVTAQYESSANSNKMNIRCYVTR